MRRRLPIAVSLTLSIALSGCAGFSYGSNSIAPSKAKITGPTEAPQGQLYDFPLRYIEWDEIEEFDDETTYILLGTAGVATLILLGVAVFDSDDE